MRSDSASVKYTWKHKALADLNQNPPVTDTWYIILDTTTGGVRLIQCLLRQLNDETAAKTIEARLTIDGEILTLSSSLTNNTYYYVKHNLTSDSLATTSSDRNFVSYTPLEGHSVKLEARITSAVGTNQELDGRLIYATLEAV